MSGSLKLKIRLKPRPQESESAQGRSDHKRKLDEYSPHAPSGFPSTANGNHSEVKRAKKQKQVQQAANQLQPTSSGNKVKLHIKGPWNKAPSASDHRDSSLRPSSPSQAQQSLEKGKAVGQGPSAKLQQRLPAKTVQAPGQADAAAASAYPSKKQKLKLKQQPSAAASLHADAADGAAFRGAATGVKLEAAPGPTEASIAQIPKSESTVALEFPTQAILERIVDKMQRKDTWNIFRNPVTEAVAPGYFQVVQHGMDFTTMRSKLQADSYSTWQLFQEDMDVMFENAMAYNTPDTVYHKQARSLKTVAAKMVELAKQGVTDFRSHLGSLLLPVFSGECKVCLLSTLVGLCATDSLRGKTVQESRAHNAQIAAEEQAYRNEQRSAKSTSLASKVAEQFGGASGGMSLRHTSTAGSQAEAADSIAQAARAAPRVHRPVVRESDMRKFAGQEEQNNRATYWQTPSAPYYARWKGLAAGASAESMALQPGRPILRPVVLLGRDSYVRSIARFTSGLKGRFKDLAKAKAAPCVFPEPAMYSQTSNSGQLPASSGPGMVASGPKVGSAIPMATSASTGNQASPAGLFSTTAAVGAQGHGSLAAGPGLHSGAALHAGQLHSTVAGQSSVAHVSAARPVPMAYNAAQPLTYSTRPVQQHM